MTNQTTKKDLTDLQEQGRLLISPAPLGSGVNIQLENGDLVKCRVMSVEVKLNQVAVCKAASIAVPTLVFEFTEGDWLHSVFPVGMKPPKQNKPPEECTLSDLLSYAGFSQQKLADCIGVSQPMISYWCRGEFVPDAFQAIELADHLKCRVDTLIHALKNSRDQSVKYPPK